MYLFRCHHEARRIGDCDIVFFQSVYKKVVEHIALDTSRELGGLLLGYEAPSVGDEPPTIYITDAVAAKYAQESPTQLIFTEETWLGFDVEIEKKIKDTKIRRLGWYHSHLGYSVFLSKYDLDVCASFSKPTHVALVVDPVKDEGGFFVNGIGGYRSNIPQGFWEQPDICEESIVTWKNMSQVLPSTPKQYIKPFFEILKADHLNSSSTGSIGYTKSYSASLIRRDLNPIKVLFSYSHKDEVLRDELARHLSLLKHQGVITEWYDRKITAGDKWKSEISKHLDTAQIILLLISSDFLASQYCYGIEMKRALERHDYGEAIVIPIILRDVDWEGAPFSELQALPKDAKPVTSWPNIDEAFADIARGIRKIIAALPQR